jgi:hypothetical protein
LPTFESRLAGIAAAERGEGWLIACVEDDRFLVLTREVVAALAARLRSLGDGPALEVCAGRGELAEALCRLGVALLAADADPPEGSPVRRASAEEALREHRPSIVLGSFVPIDAGVDEAVMTCSSVRHYLVLSARIGGLVGSPALWRNPAWKGEPIHQISRWMLTRHDVWLGTPERLVIQHGEAWHFERMRADEDLEP